MFLNPLLLIGVAAAVVPLVIHFLSRSRYRTVDWGAMMFLDGAAANKERRSQFHQWVLLGIRSLMIGLLAMALARPVVKGSHNAPTPGQHVTAVILLDCSASMGYDENGHTRMVLAKGTARQVLSLHTTDPVSLVLLGREQPPSERAPTSDLWDIARRIDSAEPAYGRADIAQGLIDAIDAVKLRAAMRLAGDGSHGVTDFVRFYVVTDRQNTSWAGVDESFRAAWPERLRQSGLAGRLFFLPVGNTESENVAVESIDLLNGPAVAGMPVEMEVRLRNFGPVRWASLPLTVTADRRVILDQKVNLAPDSTATFHVSLKEGFVEAGSHLVSAEVNRIPAGVPAQGTPRPTGMIADDRFDTVIEAIEPIRVLVLNGDEGGQPAAADPKGADARSSDGEFRGEGDYLQLALAPFKTSKRKGGDLCAVDIVSPDAWNGPAVTLPKRGGEPERQQRLGHWQVIVLANVERLSSWQVRGIEQFVYDGGGLLIAPGNLVRPSDYNETLFRNGAGILPAVLREPTADDGSDLTNLSGFDTAHPIFRFLGGQPEPFLTATIGRYFPVDRRAAGARELAHYVTGDPFLIESRAGRGRVLLVTTALDTDWTTLPLTPFYLPFVQSAARYLADTTPRRAVVAPGEQIEVRVDGSVPAREIRVIAPDGQVRQAEILRPNDQTVIRVADTRQPGPYAVQIQPPGKKIQSYHFVVRATRDESDLTPLSEERWKWLEQSFGVETIDPAERSLSMSPAASSGNRELWGWLLGGVLLLAVIEMALARRWSSTDSTSDPSTADLRPAEVPA